MKRCLRALLLILVALPLRALGAKEGGKNVAVLVFPGVQIIDSMGPWEVFGHAFVDGQPAFHVYSVAETLQPIETAMGLSINPGFTFARSPKPEVLILPGGDVAHQLEDAETIRWVRETAKSAEVVFSVCNGAFFLAKAGLLDGLEATTFAGLIEELKAAAPKTKVVSDKRFVDNGKIVTAAGLSSGIDGALHVIEKLYGRGTAQVAAVSMEYDWRPDSGWARASLAEGRLSPGYAAIREYSRNVVRHEGTRDRWETAWTIRTDAGASAVLARLDRAFAETPGWRRQGPGSWRFEGGGGAWTETTKVEATRGEKAYLVTMTVARAK